MPANKDLKRLVRSRMRKTGESYTTARAQLLAKRRRTTPEDVSVPVIRADHAALAGMSDDAVRAKTGRTWRQWTRVLDGVGASEKPHREIASHLRQIHGLEAWWAQMVAVGYERIRGLRDVGQRRDGDHEISKSRTFPVAMTVLYAACATVARRRRWLRESGIVVRKAAADKSLQWTWPDGTRVELQFDSKGPAKSRIVVQHRMLPTRDAASQAKRSWEIRLDALAAVLGAPRVSGPRRSGTTP